MLLLCIQASPGLYLVRVHGPVGYVIAIEEHGFPRRVASLEAVPGQARAPFDTTITVTARPGATTRIYPWKLILRDATTNRILGEEVIVLVILPRGLSHSIAGHIVRLARLCKK